MTTKEFLRPATTMNPQRNTQNSASSNQNSWKKPLYHNSSDNDFFPENRPYSSGIRLPLFYYNF